jgi:hypothetical protein
VCEFNRKGFVEGCSALNVSCLKDLKDTLPKLRLMVDDLNICSQIYKFTFGFCTSEKVMLLEYALFFWEMLLRNKFLLLDQFLDFCRQNGIVLQKTVLYSIDRKAINLNNPKVII